MRHILAVIDTDARYAQSLADYINKTARLPFKAAAYSSINAYEQKNSSLSGEIVLIAEELYKDFKPDKKPASLIILSEEGLVKKYTLGERAECMPVILKYISADEVISEVLRLYRPSNESLLLRLAGRQSEIIGVYSPVNRCGKTEHAAAISMISEEKKKTLLISFDEYNGIFYKAEKDFDTDLSDVLYCFKKGNYSWDKIGKAAHTLSGLNFIPPARYTEDVAEFSVNELAEIIMKIARDSGYEILVIDFGLLGKRAVELLEFCDKIYMPLITDSAAERKVGEFYNYLVLTGREIIKEKIISFYYPYDTHKEIKQVGDIPYMPLGEYWRSKLAGGFLP